jgi:prepilin-type N-terminal cleavage/methylation domain-containing protein
MIHYCLPANNLQKRGFTLVEVIFALSLFGMLVGGLLAFLPWGVEGVAKIKDRNTAISFVDAVQIELERLGFVLVEAGTHRLNGMYEFAGKPKDSNFINQIILVGEKKGGGVSLEKVIRRAQIAGSDGQITVDYSKDPQLLTNFAKDMGGQIEFDLYQQFPISLKGMEIIESAGTQTYSMNRWIEPRDRYFAIVCSQYPADSRHAHHVSNGYLALECEVQWPYKIFDPSNQNSSDSLLTNAREIEEKFRTKFTFPVAISR